MAKLPSYAGLSIAKSAMSETVDGEPLPDQSPPGSTAALTLQSQPAKRTRAMRRTPSADPDARLRDRGRSTVVTMSPAFVRELKLYCLEADRSMHSVILEAIEDWAKRNGLKGPVQA